MINLFKIYKDMNFMLASLGRTYNSAFNALIQFAVADFTGNLSIDNFSWAENEDELLKEYTEEIAKKIPNSVMLILGVLAKLNWHFSDEDKINIATIFYDAIFTDAFKEQLRSSFSPKNLEKITTTIKALMRTEFQGFSASSDEFLTSFSLSGYFANGTRAFTKAGGKNLLLRFPLHKLLLPLLQL
jgi:hypothetical protein